MAVASLTLLSACSSGSDGATSTPPPKAPTAIPTGQTSGTTPPGSSGTGAEAAAWARVPKPARQHTMAGAQAFAEFYLSQINEAWRLPDPAVLRPYGSGSCASCANYVRTATALQAKGQRYDGPAGTVRALAWLPESTRDQVYVSALTQQEARQILNQVGTVERSTAEAKVELKLQLAWREARWYVDEIKVVGSPT